MLKYVVKFLPLFCILFITQNAFSQQNKREKRAQRVIILGSTELGVRSSNMHLNSAKNILTNSEQSNIWDTSDALTSELKVGLSIKKNIFLISGIRYKQQELRQHDGYMHSKPESNSESGILDEGSILFDYGRDVSVNSIEIPLEIRIDLIFGRISVSPSIGINAGINVKQEQSTYNTSDANKLRIKDHYIDVQDLKTDNKLNLSTTTKLELAYSLKNRSKIKLSATHHLYLVDEIIIAKNARYRMQEYGLQVGYEIPLVLECPSKNYYGF